MLALTMIVKNEAHVIRRCLDSTKPLIDYVLVVDTGSTDGTQDVIRAWLKENNLPGQVLEEPWVDFATNRTSALAHVRSIHNVDYVLMIDADEILEYDPDFDAEALKASLTADVYEVMSHYNGLIYPRPQLTRNDLPVRYRGVLHEFVDCETGWRSFSRVSGFHNKPIQDGARSKDPEKYRHDAAVLENAIAEGRDPDLLERYTFYAAQCRRDAGDNQQALEGYLRRSEMPGGFQQEIFVSLLMAGRLAESLNRSGLALTCYDEAARKDPRRAEAWHAIARLARSKNWLAITYAAAQIASSKTPPADALFTESWIYDFQAKDELAVASHYVGELKLAAELNHELLRSGKLPEHERERVMTNLALAENLNV